MDAPVQDLIAGAATFLLYRFFGVKECSPVSGECVCVHNDYLVRKCNWGF